MAGDTILTVHEKSQKTRTFAGALRNLGKFRFYTLGI